MQNKETTSSYLELTTQGYEIFANALASTNQRTLDYMKSVYEIATRPYASTALETTMRENFDRANQVMSLTVSEMQTSGQQAADLSEKFVAHGAKLQETAVSTLRGLVDNGLSNLKYVKETATQQIDEMVKRADEASSPATAQISAN